MPRRALADTKTPGAPAKRSPDTLRRSDPAGCDSRPILRGVLAGRGSGIFRGALAGHCCCV